MTTRYEEFIKATEDAQTAACAAEARRKKAAADLGRTATKSGTVRLRFVNGLFTVTQGTESLTLSSEDLRRFVVCVRQLGASLFGIGLAKDAEIEALKKDIASVTTELAASRVEHASAVKLLAEARSPASQKVGTHSE